MPPSSISCGPITVYFAFPDSYKKDLNAAHLHPLEIAKSVEIRHRERQCEFLNSRHLTRQHLPFTDPILGDDRGVIQWPAGYAGSISHKDGIAALGYGSTDRFLAVGIDLENSDRFREELAPKICTDLERELLMKYSQQLSIPLKKLLAITFSFKESIFKCHFPLGRTWFYFHDAELVGLDWEARRISARLKMATSPQTPLGFECTGHFDQFEWNGSQYCLTSHVASKIDGAKNLADV